VNIAAQEGGGSAILVFGVEEWLANLCARQIIAMTTGKTQFTPRT
jgi:hypothetical protein